MCIRNAGETCKILPPYYVTTTVKEYQAPNNTKLFKNDNLIFCDIGKNVLKIRVWSICN